MMAGLSAMVKSPSCRTGIFWRGLMRVNSVGLGLAGARQDGMGHVVERQLVQRPDRAQRAAGGDSPQVQPRLRLGHVTTSRSTCGGRARGSSRRSAGRAAPSRLRRSPCVWIRVFGGSESTLSPMRARMRLRMASLSTPPSISEMGDVDVLRPELARHRLRHGAQAELCRGEGGKARAAAHAGGGAGEQDGAVAARHHVARRLAAGEEAAIAGELPGLAEQRLGRLQQRRVDVRAGVVEADFDGPDLALDLGEQVLDRGLLAGIDAEGLHRAAVGRDLVDQRLGLGSVASRHADLQSAGGEASGNGGADGIARAHEQGDGPAGCHVRFPCSVSCQFEKNTNKSRLVRRESQADSY